MDLEGDLERARDVEDGGCWCWWGCCEEEEPGRRAVVESLRICDLGL